MLKAFFILLLLVAVVSVVYTVLQEGEVPVTYPEKCDDVAQWKCAEWRSRTGEKFTRDTLTTLQYMSLFNVTKTSDMQITDFHFNVNETDGTIYYTGINKTGTYDINETVKCSVYMINCEVE
jgi:hypothetical protein